VWKTRSSGFSKRRWTDALPVHGRVTVHADRGHELGNDAIEFPPLDGTRPTAVVALTILGTVAKQTQGPVNYRQEADGLVHEMYVW
jgi:hypothetical protein